MVYDRVFRRNEEVILINRPDDICKKCPELQNGLCKSESKVNGFDKKVMEFFKKRLDIHKKILPSILYEELKNMSINEFEGICQECSWHSLGYCKQGLLSLKNTRQGADKLWMKNPFTS